LETSKRSSWPLATQILRQTVQFLHTTAFPESIYHENTPLTFSDQLAVKLKDGAVANLMRLFPHEFNYSLAEKLA